MDFKKLLEAMDEFAGERVGQKPGDQVRGTDKAKPNKGKHPFLKRLVGELKQPKSTHKYEQELSEAWLEFKEAAPVPGQPAAAPGAAQQPAAGAAAAPATPAATTPTTPPAKPGQPDPKTAAELKKGLTNLKTVLPGLDITKATNSMAKADDAIPLSPADQAIVGKIAPQIADVIKNPQMATQFKAMINKASQTDAAADKAAGVATPAAPGAPVPPGTQPK
jgi:hypothetical protein